MSGLLKRWSVPVFPRRARPFDARVEPVAGSADVAGADVAGATAPAAAGTADVVGAAVPAAAGTADVAGAADATAPTAAGTADVADAAGMVGAAVPAAAGTADVADAGMASDVAAPAWRVSAAHDGYRRLRGRPIHRRAWQLSATGLSVIDVIEGESGPAAAAAAAGQAVARFHLHPAIRIDIDQTAAGLDPETETRGRLTLPDGRTVSWRARGGRAAIVSVASRLWRD